MNMCKPLEALLRPPVEWYTTGVALIGSIFLIKFSSIFMLTKLPAYSLSMLLLTIGLLRFKQGYRVWHYQKNLNRMPVYKITYQQLPMSQKKLFLGKGFLWTAQHTQRLSDLDLSYNLHYKSLSKLKQWARRKELAWENNPYFKKLLPWFAKESVWNPFRPYPDIGGEPCIHGVSDKEEDVFIHLSERASHLLVLGLPGVGKTRFAETLISQDIRRGDVVIVLDPKGDSGLLKRMYIEAKLAGRAQDLCIFHLGFPAVSSRYNPVGNFTRVTEVASRIANQLPDSGNSAAFKEFGWQFINTIAVTLVFMGEKPDYKKIQYYITKMDELLEKYLNSWLPSIDTNFFNWVDDYIVKFNEGRISKKNKKTNQDQNKNISRLKAMIAYVKTHHLGKDMIFDDLYHVCQYEKSYFSKITASLGPLLKKLTSGSIADLLSPDDSNLRDGRPILDWLQAIQSKKIVYVGLDALTDREVAAAVGNAMFSDLVSIAGRLYKFGLNDGFCETPTHPIKSPRICLHSDEFNEIIGDEFIPLLNKGRGAGFTITAYTQTWSDVEARLKVPAKAGQVAGNFGTIVMFRCTEKKTVEMLLGQLRKVPILRVISASSSSDAPHEDDDIYYGSSNEDRLTHVEQRLIEQADILNLPKGQAFCLLKGGKLFKLRVPLSQDENIFVKNDLENIFKEIYNEKRI